MTDVIIGNSFTNPKNVFSDEAVVEPVVNQNVFSSQDDSSVSSNDAVVGNSFTNQTAAEVISEEDQKLIDDEESINALEDANVKDNLLTLDPISKSY